MDFISLCDGSTSLLQIAEVFIKPIWELCELADKLKAHDLISVVNA